MAKLTVLMPVYNASAFLREAIDSILTQTFVDFELLIIDDASTDSSSVIIKSYSDPRVRYIRNNINLGISESLNKGIQLAETELIARMDADDICYPDRLEKQHLFFEQQPACALLSSWVRIISEDGREIGIEKFKSEFYFYNLTFDCWMYHPSVMFRKSAVISVGAYSEKYAEDFDLFWKLSTRYQIANLEEVLLDYRISSQSLHLVTKKKEYDEAMNRLLRRNVHHYCPGLAINDSDIDYLRFKFPSKASAGQIAGIIAAFRKLKKITIALAIKETPNTNPSIINAAYRFRRRHMMLQVDKMPRRQVVVIKVILRVLQA